MIYFHIDENISYKIFIKVYEELKKGEELEYPFHYKIIEKKNDFYKKYLEKKSQEEEDFTLPPDFTEEQLDDLINRYCIHTWFLDFIYEQIFILGKFYVI